MALSACVECYKITCVCGRAYQYYSVKEFSTLIADMLQLRAEEEAVKILKQAEKIIKERKI